MLKGGRLYTVREASRWLNCSYYTVYRMTLTGELPAVRIGKSIVRVAESDLQALVDRGRGVKVHPWTRGKGSKKQRAGAAA